MPGLSLSLTLGNPLLFPPSVPTSAPTLEADLVAAFSGRGNCDLYDFTQATTYYRAVGLARNRSLSQTTASLKPDIDPALGAIMDGTAQMGAPFATGTYTVVLAMRKDPADGGNSHIVKNAVVYADGDGAGTAGTVTVDDAAVTTRNDLHDALDDGAEHIVSITGLPQSNSVDLGRSTSGMIGSIRRAVIMLESEPADLAGARSKAKAWLGQGVS
ncbi:hypothetical protein [Aurantiacibacter spongiae]|uniref:Uncharacterized protein n=1 Tax=Aurantiacibacter spongiae TaxID=2488860 RepID=A0A3N5D7D6_9SPHN|nr:hypothetical protein [Aurantiacibacter spongiae]RPF70438.1 hypothetical protein EG799_01445 [Aurantiacibacter spongiae]